MNLSASMTSVDPLEVGRALDAVAPHVGSWHVDVMDGRFAPAFGFGPAMVASLVERYRTPVDVHLMIERPEVWAPRFAAMGVRSVAFHAEAVDNAPSVARSIRAEGAEALVALRPETSVRAVRHLLDDVDGCLLLTAPAGGGPFNHTALLKAFDLPEHLVTVVDGRIDESHFGLLRSADVTDVVIGQALFGTEDVDARGAVLASRLATTPAESSVTRRSANVRSRSAAPRSSG